MDPFDFPAPFNMLLNRIKSMKSYGNPDKDATLMALCHELIMGDYPMDDKLEALSLYYNICYLGLRINQVDVYDVLAYIEDNRKEKQDEDRC